MAAKVHPFSASIWYNTTTGDTATSNFTSIADVRSIRVGGVEYGETDITHLSSTGAFKESMASWGKQKPMGFSMYFDEDRLLTFLETTAPGSYTRLTYSWLVKFPDPTQPTTVDAMWVATAYISDIDIPEFTVDNDDAIRVDVQLQPTGRPDWNTSSTGA